MSKYWDSVTGLELRREKLVSAFRLKGHTILTKSLNQADTGDFYFVNKTTGRVRVGNTLSNSSALSNNWHKRLWGEVALEKAIWA